MRRARPLSISAVVIGVLALVWLAKAGDDWGNAFSFTGKKKDYYNLLVHGFQQGHLYMDAKADPALWSTEPIVRRRAGYLQDASLYEHRYYLYYGVVPGALLFLPYSVLTGGDLSPNAVTLTFALLGFAFAFLTYRRARDEYFPRIGPILDSLNVLLLAFGSVSPLLVKCSGVYEVAVVSGYACLAAATYFLFRAMHAGAGGLGWLAAASVSLGLSVGCRPNYILSLPILVAVAYFMRSVRDRESPGTGKRSTLRLLLSIVVPAAAIGCLLAAYNYGRFGDPLDFGFKYGMNAFTGTGRPIASASFMWPNFRWYYLTAPVVLPYFPYCASIDAAALPPGYFSPESIHGQCLAGVLFCVVAAACTVSFARGRTPNLKMVVFMSALAWMTLSGLVFMISLGVRADRYMTDFQAPLVLFIALASGLSLQKDVTRGASDALLRLLYGAAAAAVVLFNFFVALEVFDNFENLRPKEFKRLARIGDMPMYYLAQHGLVDFGPARFKVVFPPSVVGLTGPLIAVGTPNHTDTLVVEEHPEGWLEFAMVHEGSVGLRSGRVPFVAGRPYTVEAEMGCLYPPRVSPYYDGMDTKRIDRLKTTARVRVDGKEVISGRLSFYDSSPGMVYYGANPQENGGQFHGRITEIQRLPPIGGIDGAESSEPGIWRADISVPWLAPDVGHPLLGSGVTGHGNLLFVDVPARNQIRFDFDLWGSGVRQSLPLDVAPGVHRVEIFVGPQVASLKWPASWHLDDSLMKKSQSLLKVWWDGALVWTTPITSFQDTYDLVSLGSNPQGFSTTDMLFPAGIEFMPYTRAETRDFISRNLLGAK